MAELVGVEQKEVETQVSRPIEEALSTVEGVVSIESRSRAGISDVVLEFDWDTSMGAAMQDVRRREGRAASEVHPEWRVSVTRDPTDNGEGQHDAPPVETGQHAGIEPEIAAARLEQTGQPGAVSARGEAAGLRRAADVVLEVLEQRGKDRD